MRQDSNIFATYSMYQYVHSGEIGISIKDIYQILRAGERASADAWRVRDLEKYLLSLCDIR